MPEIRITVRGLIPSLALLLGIVMVPQLLAGTLSRGKAESLIADVHARRAAAALTSYYESRPEGAPVTEEMRRLAKQLEHAREIQFESIEVRRGLMVPPFSRRTAFYVEACRTREAPCEYFKVSRGYATPVDEFWWQVRL